MSRLAGTTNNMSADRIGNRRDIGKWSAHEHDWTMALNGGPLDGTARRSQFCPWRYERTVNTNAGLMVDKYEVTGFSPYQRVVFMRYRGRASYVGRVRGRTIRGAADLKRYMEQDGDL